MNVALPIYPVIPSPWSVFKGALHGIGILLAGLSDYAEKKVLDLLTGKAAFASPAPLYLALLTVVAVDADTGATLTEANYTGYARKQIPAADWNAASGTTAVVTNAVQEAFADCTGGSSVVVGVALCDAAGTGAGNMIASATCATVTITPTQTPPTLGAGALSVTAD